jgi:Ca2+-binding EF-hand superfamily protein
LLITHKVVYTAASLYLCSGCSVCSRHAQFFDRDGDGEVTEAEFLAGILLLQGYSSKDFLLQLFRLQDTDQNGVLSLREVATVVDFLLAFVRGTVYVVCEILDEEIVDQLAEENFRHMDKDNSGSIDMVEWLTTRHNHGSHGIERLLMTEFVSLDDVPQLVATFKELADDEGYVSRLQFVDHVIADAMMSGLHKRFASVANQETLKNVLHSPGVLGLLQNFFHFLDKDGDGRLSLEEFQQGIMVLAQPPKEATQFQFTGIASGVGLRASTMGLDMVSDGELPSSSSSSSSSSVGVASVTAPNLPAASDAKWKGALGFELS